GKDQYEGYGMINPDAAVEGATLNYAMGTVSTDTLGPGAINRRAWARRIHFVGGKNYSVGLTVPGGGDFDLYLYSTTPSAYGTPVLVASSTSAGNGVGELISYTPVIDTDLLLVVKRVTGNGTFSLIADVPPVANFVGGPTNGAAP